jgi:hypothetical protein
MARNKKVDAVLGRGIEFLVATGRSRAFPSAEAEEAARGAVRRGRKSRERRRVVLAYGCYAAIWLVSLVARKPDPWFAERELFFRNYKIAPELAVSLEEVAVGLPWAAR